MAENTPTAESLERAFFTGTVIHGTLRLQDLVPAFLDALHELKPDYELNEPIPQCALDDDDDAYWYGAVWFTIEELEDELDACVAEYGYYFGAHAGDGSDFGFWLIED